MWLGSWPWLLPEGRAQQAFRSATGTGVRERLHEEAPQPSKYRYRHEYVADTHEAHGPFRLTRQLLDRRQPYQRLAVAATW